MPGNFCILNSDLTFKIISKSNFTAFLKSLRMRPQLSNSFTKFSSATSSFFMRCRFPTNFQSNISAKASRQQNFKMRRLFGGTNDLACLCVEDDRLWLGREEISLALMTLYPSPAFLLCWQAVPSQPPPLTSACSHILSNGSPRILMWMDAVGMKWTGMC